MTMGFDPGPDGMDHLFGWYDYEYGIDPDGEPVWSESEKQKWIAERQGRPEDFFEPIVDVTGLVDVTKSSDSPPDNWWASLSNDEKTAVVDRLSEEGWSDD